ncbi:IS481 family transposase, partial [Stagnimonas aquatica]
MRIHGNARLTVSGRRELIRRIEEEGWSVADAALAACISERSAWKWLARFRAEGDAGLQDRSSRPVAIRRRLSISDRERASQQRVGNRWPVARIADELGLPRSTLARVLAQQGLGRLPPLTPPPPVVRYE